MNKVESIVHVDNEHVRVIEWRLAPGAATGWHRHGFAYVITPITAGQVLMVGPDHERVPFAMQPGQSYYRDAGVEHDVVNGPEGALVFIEMEIKSLPG
jgi:quercetin dioxygenase-like cupin family protein